MMMLVTRPKGQGPRAKGQGARGQPLKPSSLVSQSEPVGKGGSRKGKGGEGGSSAALASPSRHSVFAAPPLCLRQELLALIN
ncbi:hypothetical protein BDDG_05493 [Blastomyces dermatitidis ATCC 18188]|uniref:Uncharacterized protein n=1 Tax=Ajellomyces dermatitidis (strain ATCC 18188 / CBS 674.68) TaxID=653446 RepID=F2TH36_AJEDA|nr:hypothetical protein BDDG_05493 [Blastomyces dermatitidis ATCC 18188]